MQLAELVITSREQARALQDSGFLGRFLEAASPSDVARSLGMPANLAHHHAKRHAELGLLVEVRRERGRVYYQLAARTFRHRHSLLPAGDPDEHTAAALKSVRDRFLSEYEAFERTANGQDTDWHVYAFDRDNLPEPESGSGAADAVLLRPPHFQTRTVSLSAERYRELVQQIAGLVAAAERESRAGAKPCTLVFLAMEGVLQDGSADNQFLSSFMPLDELLGRAAEPASGELKPGDGEPGE